MDNRRKSATNNVDRTVGVGNFEGKDERLNKKRTLVNFSIARFIHARLVCVYIHTYVRTHARIKQLNKFKKIY